MGENVRRWRSWTAAATTLLGLAVTGTSSTTQRPHVGEMTVASRNHANGYGSGSNAEPVAFAVSGSPLKGLYPGLTKNMAMTLYNPYRYDLTVKSLTGFVVRSSKRACHATAANLVVRPFSGPLPVTVRSRHRKNVGVIPIHMPRSASTSCQGTSFTIRLAGTAKKASR
jgi:hypothetical protein